jgi:hypothetical protein
VRRVPVKAEWRIFPEQGARQGGWGGDRWIGPLSRSGKECSGRDKGKMSGVS